MKSPNLRTSVAAWFVGLTLLMLVLFSTTLYFSIKRALLNGLDDRMKAHASGLATMCEIDDESGEVELELEPELRQHLSRLNPDRSEEVWTWPTWRRLHSGGPSIDVALPEESWQEGRDLLNDPATEFETIKAQQASRRLCTALIEIPALSDDDGSGVVTPPFRVLVRVSEDLDPVQEQLAQLSWTLLCIGGIALGVVFGFATFLSRRFVRPIRELGEAAAAIQAGQSAKLPRRGARDELDALCDVLEEAFHRLEEALARQARFTSDAAHELRNPISVIQNAARVALRRNRSPEEYRELLEDVLGTSVRMGTVVEALLFLARMDIDQSRNFLHDVDLAEIARDSVEGIPEARGRVKLRAGEDARVRGDETLLRVLVDNLISNALRYSDPKAPVEIGIDVDRDVILRVEDEGPGIPPEAVSHVFDRFYRVERTAHKVRGVGLGLSIVAEVARLHSAVPEIASSKRGTTVTVRFPIQDNAA